MNPPTDINFFVLESIIMLVFFLLIVAEMEYNLPLIMLHCRVETAVVAVIIGAVVYLNKEGTDSSTRLCFIIGTSKQMKAIEDLLKHWGNCNGKCCRCCRNNSQGVNYYRFRAIQMAE